MNSRSLRKTDTKFLVIAPAWIGDMVLAQSLFKFLKMRHPKCRIDVLAPEWSLPLLSFMPEIEKAIALPIAHGQLALKVRFQISKQLKKNDYDHAIVLPNSFKSSLIPFIAKIPHRRGWLGEWRFLLLNDIRYLDKVKFPRMVERFVALALDSGEDLPIELPRPKLFVPESEIEKTLDKYGLNFSNKNILVLCPGAEFGPAKRWPENYFAKVAQEKLAVGWEVWIFGTKKDKPQAIKIQELCNHNCVDFTGKTSLAEAVHLLACASLIVTNDSGLMHMGAALDKALVTLYGSSSPKFTPPLSDKARVLSLNLPCSPCYKRECPLIHFNCMVQLTPDKVLQTIDQIS